MSMTDHQLREQNEILREQVRQLKDALTAEFRAPAEWHLTRSENTIMGVLVQLETASLNAIMTALYGTRPGDVPNQEIVGVFICRMRRKLKPFGITIQTVIGVGFFLDPETRQRLKGGDA